MAASALPGATFSRDYFFVTGDDSEIGEIGRKH